MNGGCAEIVPADQPIRSDLSLDTQVPLIDIRILHGLRIDRIGPSQREERIAQADRKRISSRRALPWIIKATRRRRELQASRVRRVHEHWTRFLRIRQFVENPVRRPNHGLSTQPLRRIGKPGPRGKVLVFVIGEGPRIAIRILPGD